MLVELFMNRSDQILKYIIETFVETAEPVSSKKLIEKYNLKFSSATIRNEMQNLENQSYLEKTHTSSGRVPSAKGYQYYVDNLREGVLNTDIKFQLQSMLDERLRSVQEILTKSCEVLSQMTNLTSVILGSNAKDELLASLHMVPLSNNSATVIFITNKGNVVNKTFFFDEKVSQSDFKNCIDIIAKRLINTKLVDLENKLKSLKPILQDYIVNGDLLYQSLLSTLSNLTNSRAIMYGKEHLLEQPEFSNNPNDVKNIVKLLDSPEFFKDISDDTLKNNGISIKIGNKNSRYENLSILSAKVDLPGAKDNIISLIGPVRMDYQSAISILKGLVNEIDAKYNKK